MKMSKQLFLFTISGFVTSAFADTVEVHMAASKDGKMHFVPDSVTIKKGSTVKWVNDDAKKQFHTVTSGKMVGSTPKPDKLFDSRMIPPGKTFERVFNESGEFNYYCVPHVAMKMFGKIVVK